jgi:hypothetical protein
VPECLMTGLASFFTGLAQLAQLAQPTYHSHIPLFTGSRYLLQI